MLRRVVILFVMALLSVSVAGVSAQGSSCPAIVEDALASVDVSCTTIGRNQACYGNILIDAELNQAVTFNERGDIVPLSAVDSLSLSPMIEAESAWGVALLQTQANLPDTLPGQNVTMLLFGDTYIEAFYKAGDAVEVAEVEVERVIIEVSPSGSGNINVRGGPGTGFAVVGVLPGNSTVSADGRNSAGDWLRVTLEDGRIGWVFADLLDGDAFDTLEVLEDAALSADAGTRAIAPGDEVRGTLTRAALEQTYTFQAFIGEAFDITLQAESAGLDTYLEILNAAGDLVAFNDDAPDLARSTDSALRPFIATETGEFTINVTSFRRNDVGDYVLTLDYAEEGGLRAPMQAFYFTSGIGATGCVEMPRDGVLIQTPEGAGEVLLLANEVLVELGSTIYMQADPDDSMYIYVLEGRARVQAFGGAQFVPEGTVTRIPIDGRPAASGPPEPPVPYDLDVFTGLPLGVMGREIVIADPADDLLTGDVVITLDWDSEADMDVWLIERTATVLWQPDFAFRCAPGYRHERGLLQQLRQAGEYHLADGATAPGPAHDSRRSMG